MNQIISNIYIYIMDYKKKYLKYKLKYLNAHKILGGMNSPPPLLTGCLTSFVRNLNGYTGHINTHKERHGEGTQIYENGSEYRGQWENNQLHGDGVLIFPERKRVYEGQFAYYKIHGKGKMTTKDKHFYDGDWVNGKRHGSGKMKNELGTYDGQWNDDMMHGEGTFKYTNCLIYNGMWKNDEKHGKGTLIAENLTYQGEWAPPNKYYNNPIVIKEGDTTWDGSPTDELKEEGSHRQGVILSNGLRDGWFKKTTPDLYSIVEYINGIEQPSIRSWSRTPKK